MWVGGAERWSEENKLQGDYLQEWERMNYKKFGLPRAWWVGKDGKVKGLWKR